MAKFLNSSIVSFNESVAWGAGEISCDINLVDCAVGGDSFSPPSVGTPCYFEFDSHKFLGLLDRYTTSYSSGGYPTYSVHLSNGVFLLQGTKVILNNFYGTTNTVPNLINVFGYLENTLGFGGSEVNSAGISWYKVFSTVNTLINNSAGTVYGGCIKHKTFKYGIDLSLLPSIPNSYRINSDSVSLLEFIEEVCEAGGHDFFIKLEYLTQEEQQSTGLDAKFKIYTVSRLNEPTPGEIQNFVNSTQCVTQKEIGQEIRKDSNSKFVIGANVEQMWFVYPTTSGDGSPGITEQEYSAYSILPYVGNDKDGNYIVGHTRAEQPDEYYFNIDIRDVAHPELGETYETCVSELRAAKKGRDSWEVFLAKNACNKYIMSTGSGPNVTAKPFTIAVPSSVGYKQIYPFDPVGEYGPFVGQSGTYFFEAIPKYGYIDVSKKYAQNKRKALPNTLTPSTYYWKYVQGVYPPDYFTHSNLSVNSAINKGPATGNRLLPVLYYPATDVTNPYYMRAFKLRTPAAQATFFARILESDLYQLTQIGNQDHAKYWTSVYNTFTDGMGKDDYTDFISKKYAADITKPLDKAGNNDENKIDGYYAEKATRIYKKIKDLADNYFGKRYLVSIPSTYGAIEPESTTLRLSQEPTDAGYLDSVVWPSAYASGLIPSISGLNILLSPEDKFYPYVKYEKAIIYSGIQPSSIPYNYSEIGINDRVFSNPKPYPTSSGAYTSFDMWVKCSVSNNVVFKNTSTLSNPRAIVELPGAITYSPYGNYSTKQVLNDAITRASGMGGAFYNDPNFTESTKQKILSSIGGDELELRDGEPYVIPDLFAVPLKSNVLCYGPWYYDAGSITNGPVEYEKNDDLAPWNYGGYTAMNIAGFARVNDGITNQTFDETGSVTVAGAPDKNIGDRLVNGSGGPYITSVNVSVGVDGINTQYSFQTWSSQRRLSKLSNFNNERIKRLNQRSRDFSRAFREGVGNNSWKNPLEFFNDIRGKFVNLEEYAKRDRSSTSHAVIAAQNSAYSSTVVIQPHYNMSTQVADNYKDKSFMSLDGIFRPYANLPQQSSFIPSLTMPEDTGALNTSYDLYPLKVENSISILAGASGGKLTNDGVSGKTNAVEINESGVPDYKGIALANPLVLCGPGRDISDDPVPLMVDASGEPILDSGGNKQWDYDAWYNPSKWKVGVLKTRWDEQNGVWVAGGDGTIKIRFSIYDSDCESCSAIVKILSRTNAVSAVPEEYEMPDGSGGFIEETNEAGQKVRSKFVTVYDKLGCFLNESNVNLQDRLGYAEYMRGAPKCDYQPWKGWEISALAEQQTECEI